MARLLSVTTLILVIILFPPAVLAFVSNNAVPGDATYPIKRSLESVILAVVSINPSTRAWFAQERSDRRFSESIVLVSKDRVAAAQTLDELVSQTEVAAREIEKVQDEVKKEELKKELASAIQKYNNGLSKIQQQLEAEKVQPPAPTPTSQPTPTPVPASTPTPSAPSSTIPQPVPSLDKDKIEDIKDKLKDVEEKLELQSLENDDKDRKNDKGDRDKDKNENKEEMKNQDKSPNLQKLLKQT